MITFRSYGTARDSLVGELLTDAAAHEAGRFDEIGRRSGHMQLPLGGPPGLTKLRAALNFWDSWIDARNRGWHPEGNIAKAEWPLLARRIASDLAKDHETSDTRVSARVIRSAGWLRTTLGVAYLVAFLCAAVLPFLAFGPTGLFVLVPTVLWLAPGLRARVRRTASVTGGAVRWPGLTALVCGAAVAMMVVSEHPMAAAWMASVAVCGLLEMARARIAYGDNLRSEAEFRGSTLAGRTGRAS